MDALKRRIAYQVKRQLRMLDGIALGNGLKSAVTDIDQLNTQIRIRQPDAGPRYFLVKVSEQL